MALSCKKSPKKSALMLLIHHIHFFKLDRSYHNKLAQTYFQKFCRSNTHKLSELMYKMRLIIIPAFQCYTRKIRWNVLHH